MLKNLFIYSFLVILISFTGGNQTFARLIFVNEENAVNADNFILDFDDTATTFIDLEFGAALTAKLSYDVLNTKFTFNEDLEISGDLGVGSLTETIDSDSGAFVLNGNDVFIADSLGVEGNIYTDSTATKYQFLDIFGCIRGSASAGTVAGGNSPVVRFDGNNNSHMRCAFPVPDDWQPGTDINIETHWSPSDTSSGDIDFDLLHAAFAVGETLASGSFTDTIPNATYETVTASTQLQLYQMSADIPAADLALDDMINIRLRRTPGDAGDTYGADVNIHMIRLSYTGKKLQ